jgi:hypothetical protein
MVRDPEQLAIVSRYKLLERSGISSLTGYDKRSIFIGYRNDRRTCLSVFEYPLFSYM